MNTSYAQYLLDMASMKLPKAVESQIRGASSLDIQYDRHYHDRRGIQTVTETMSPARLRERIGTSDYARDNFVLCGDDGRYYRFTAQFFKDGGRWCASLAVESEA